MRQEAFIGKLWIAERVVVRDLFLRHSPQPFPGAIRLQQPSLWREDQRGKGGLLEQGTKALLALPQILLSLLAMGDVSVRPGHAIWPALFVAQGKAACQDPAVRSVLMPHPMLNLVKFRL